MPLLFIGWCDGLFFQLPADRQVTVRDLDEVVFRYFEQVEIVLALLPQFFFSDAAIPVDGLDFYKRAQVFHLIDMEFDVFDEIDAPAFGNRGQYPEGGGEHLFQVGTGLRFIERNIRALGPGLVISEIVDQGIFDIPFPQLEPAIGYIEISIGLVIGSDEFGLLFVEQVSNFFRMAAPGFNLNIDPLHQLVFLLAKRSDKNTNSPINNAYTQAGNICPLTAIGAISPVRVKAAQKKG